MRLFWREPSAIADDRPSNSPIVRVTSVSAGYHRIPAIIDLDLTVDSGEIVALLGANGAGKSTTIRALSGQIPLLAGTIELDGDRNPGRLYQRARRGLGLLPEANAVFKGLTCRENLRLGSGSVELALSYFPELEHKLDLKAGLVSGGEQQMVALGRVLAAKPKVLLADELSLGLAPMVVRRLLDALSAAARDGAGVLIVEQHSRVALQAADRAYVLRRGRMELAGTAEELLGRERELTDLYL
jgi:ABC-type branched-subunit amino acid transport system ATPase component